MGWFKKKTVAQATVVLPRHIAVVMDGNGRWAKKRALPRTAGHTVGAKVFEDICRYANSLGVQTMTFYAFSTENWKRPKEEVDTLMKVFRDYLKRIEQFKKENMRLRFVGDLQGLDPQLQELMREAERSSADFTGMTVNLAINYGGRDEILHAVRTLSQQVKIGEKSADQLTEADVNNSLYSDSCGDVDLLIRPGGEQRISNFLLWQSAYAELYFCDTLWPDFGPKDLDSAIEWYSKRNRRFGGV